MNDSPATGDVGTPGVYAYPLPGAAVLFDLDLVERMLVDIMRGFGAVPKRGAEVGGILLGEVEEGGTPSIHIHDYVQVPIEYRRGPSYLLSLNDVGGFEEAMELARGREKWKPVGFFRSHTRDTPGLTEEDRQFCAQYFPGLLDVAMLVKPYATRVGQAGFLMREDGVFPLGAPASEFPFRRRDIDPAMKAEETPRTERRRERKPREENDTARIEAPHVARPAATLPAEDSRPLEIGPLTPPIPLHRTSTRLEWLRAPLWLSLILLTLGAILGVEAAGWLQLPWIPKPDPFRLATRVSSSGEDVLLFWDRDAPAIQFAWRGSVTVEDGTSRTVVALDAAQLRRGSLIYRPLADRLRFRLALVSGQGTEIAAAIGWRRQPNPAR